MKAADVRQKITDDIIAQLEQGVKPWNRPWRVDGPQLVFPYNFDGKHYRGINIWILVAEQMDKGYKSGCWMTVQRAKKIADDNNISINFKGQKTTSIIFAGVETKTCKITGEDESYFYSKVIRVLNVDQIQGLPEKYYAKPDPMVGVTNPDERNAELDALISNLGAKVLEIGDSAHYVPSQDSIALPEFNQFENANRFYSTYFHELAHWTGHESRLNRKLSNRDDITAYAFEELIAELSAAMLCGLFGIVSHDRTDHASYIKSWLTALKNDQTFIAKAATKSSQAVDFILKEMGVTKSKPKEEKKAA